jgi:histidine phosphotransferase ChpT
MSITLHPRVLELVASRICHDLVSPVGAVSNGVELLQELGESAGEEAMQLIASSALQAGIRLKCFRLAYGAAGTDGNIGFKEIREVFTDWLKAGHIQAEFEPDLNLKFSMPPQGFFKCLLNMMILAEECNHGEGKVAVTALDGNKGIKVTVTGKNAGFRSGTESALSGETAPEDLDPRSVHAYVTYLFAAHFGFTITRQSEPASGVLELSLLL